jgi:hypothetical protein
MKLPLFPNRQDLQDKWWHRLAQVAVLVLTFLALLLGLLIASEGEDAAAALFLPLIVYGIGAGAYHTILYVAFGHGTSSQQKGSQKYAQAIAHHPLNKTDKIAIHIKWCNASFFAAVSLLILGGLLESDAILGVSGIAILVVIYCMVAIEVMVWKSAWKYAAIISLLLGGLIGIIAFFYAYGDAKRLVKKVGYTLNLLGPREITFFGQKRTMTNNKPIQLEVASVEKIKHTTTSKKPRHNSANQWFLKIDSLASAKKAVAQGYIAAYIIAGLTAVIALAALTSEQAIAGIDEWAMLDALLMAVAGIGMQFYSRTAALGALILYALGKAVSLSEGNMNATGAVMTVLFFLALLNGVRGAFAYHRFQFAYATKS